MIIKSVNPPGHRARAKRWERDRQERLDRIETLYDAIAHGDEKHRAWSKQAIKNHFADMPVPPIA